MATRSTAIRRSTGTARPRLRPRPFARQEGGGVARARALARRRRQTRRKGGGALGDAARFSRGWTSAPSSRCATAGRLAVRSAWTDGKALLRVRQGRAPERATRRRHAADAGRAGPRGGGGGGGQGPPRRARGRRRPRQVAQHAERPSRRRCSSPPRPRASVPGCSRSLEGPPTPQACCQRPGCCLEPGPKSVILHLQRAQVDPRQGGRAGVDGGQGAAALLRADHDAADADGRQARPLFMDGLDAKKAANALQAMAKDNVSCPRRRRPSSRRRWCRCRRSCR